MKRGSMNGRTGLARGVALLLCAATGATLLGLASGRCGDGICEGPENAALCPQDCGAPASSMPNPARALVSRDLLTWRDWLADGSFESDETAMEPFPLLGSEVEATARRTAEAARSGAWGIEVSAAASEAVFRLRTAIEKGEWTRFSLWARSPDGPTSLLVRVLGVERTGADPIVLYTLPERFAVSYEWERLEFAIDNRRGLAFAALALSLEPNERIFIDDAAIEAEEWRMADPVAGGRVVGGVNVPAVPTAPVHFALLIHIEDPALLQSQEAYFLECTAVFRELARRVHEHGGFLTIQPEEDWALAADRFAPSALADLARDYGVAYSTHTHGPNCVDPSGRPRSAEDCSRAAKLPDWSHSVAACCDPLVPTYVDNLQTLLARVSGDPVTDHNGNWEYTDPNALAGVGVATWSAFKDNRTQRTFDVLMTNPWRPSAASARDEPEAFLVHDPSTEVIYIPGWGQSLTQNLERVSSRLAPLLSQFIRVADSQRVNTCYIVTHIGHFESDDGTRYVDVDPQTGHVTLSAAFARDLSYWDAALTDIVDPLVDAGYLAWSSLPEMGERFVEWEREHRP